MDFRLIVVITMMVIMVVIMMAMMMVVVLMMTPLNFLLQVSIIRTSGFCHSTLKFRLKDCL